MTGRINNISNIVFAARRIVALVFFVPLSFVVQAACGPALFRAPHFDPCPHDAIDAHEQIKHASSCTNSSSTAEDNTRVTWCMKDSLVV